MKRVKIFGAGSIGNHLAQASRRIGFAVDVCDVDPAALERMKTSIYPLRYGAWDESIGLYLSGSEPKGGYDAIFVGTPPDSHVAVARAAVQEKPRALLIEKPLCPPDLSGLDDLVAECREHDVRAFIGYDHVVGRAAELATSAAGSRNGLLTLDVEFREHWGGIFAAHPWLSGPSDSYLGYWRRGGGALGEHSHALNLWQHFALSSGAGRVVEVSALLDVVAVDGAEYDRLAALHLVTEGGLKGRVVQDVVTRPTRKWARLQYEDGHIEWQGGIEPGVDRCLTLVGEEVDDQRVTKTRPDDFFAELSHLEQVQNNGSASPIDLERGLDTMLVIAAAHRASQTGRSVRIRYDRGYNAGAFDD